jgi:hypothetical protein
MLSRRLLAGQAEFDVEVALGPKAIRRYQYSSKAVENCLRELHRLYLEKLSAEDSSAHTDPRSAKWSDVAKLLRLSKFVTAEERSPDRYRKEIATYFAAIPAHLPPVVHDLVASTLPAVQPVMRNNTSRFLEDVEAVVHIEGPVISHSVSQRQLPPKPRPWGPRPLQTNVYMPRIQPLSSVGPVGPANRQSSATFRNDGSVTMTLLLSKLRPYQVYSFTHEVDEVLIALDPQLLSTRVTTRVTAKNIDASVEHEYEQRVAGPVDITEVLLETLARDLAP